MDKIDKNKIFNYTFYDDSHKKCVVLNTEFLKQLFEADVILLEEKEHK